MQQGTSDAATEDKVSGDTLIGELLRRKTILIPMPIDPHGKWGPMFDRFLVNTMPPEPPPSAPTAQMQRECMIW